MIIVKPSFSKSFVLKRRRLKILQFSFSTNFVSNFTVSDVLSDFNWSVHPNVFKMILISITTQNVSLVNFKGKVYTMTCFKTESKVARVRHYMEWPQKLCFKTTALKILKINTTLRLTYSVATVVKVTRIHPQRRTLLPKLETIKQRRLGSSV